MSVLTSATEILQFKQIYSLGCGSEDNILILPGCTPELVLFLQQQLHNYREI